MINSESELGRFLEASIAVLPFVALCVLAYRMQNKLSKRVSVYLYLWFLLVLFNSCIAIMMYSVGFFTDISSHHKFILIIINVMIPSVVAIVSLGIALLPSVRRLFGFASDNSSDGGVHTLAFVTVVSFTVLCFLPLLIVGEPLILLDDLSLSDSSDMMDCLTPASLLRSDVYDLCWSVVAAFFTVGYGIKRNYHETFERLGLMRLSRRQVVFAFALAFGLLGVSYVWDNVIQWVWAWRSWPITDESCLELLFAPYTSLIGAVVIGVVAGVGEELSIRGILQPRLGILLPNLLFTALHAFQYNWDALLSVFLVGIVLGVIRQRMNTTASVIVHGTYNFVLIMYEVLFV